MKKMFDFSILPFLGCVGCVLALGFQIFQGLVF
jgi:hypothetical protein